MEKKPKEHVAKLQKPGWHPGAEAVRIGQEKKVQKAEEFYGKLNKGEKKPRKDATQLVTDLRYYMDGYLQHNIKFYLTLLKKKYDIVGIITGSGLVGVGKAQPKGSKVLMADGTWKNIECVHQGDRIISPSRDGKSSTISKIKKTIQHKEIEICEIIKKGSGEKLYECCTDHYIPFKALKVIKKDGKKTYTWKQEVFTAGELVEKNENWYRNRSPKIITSPTITSYEQEDCKINPYLMGLYIGDGSISSRNGLRISNSHPGICNWLYKNFKIRRTHLKKGKSRDTILDIPTEEIHMLCGDGSYNKKIPGEALRSSFNYRKKVFEGLLDTDAYINPLGYVTYCTASEQLAGQVGELAQTLGCRVTSIKKIYKSCQSFTEKKPYYNVYINVGAFSKHISLLQEERLVRLRKRKEENTSFQTFIVKKTGKKAPGYCIEVDSPSRLYITNNYTVTHNSTIAIQVGYFIAYELGTPFTLENVVFDPETLMKVATALPRHSVIVYDEGRSGLDSARAMENINKATVDFFQECRQYGHIILIVLPNFFKLTETLAVDRSMFLINCYTDAEWNQGRFSFFNRHRKELLYVYGKKKLGTFHKYSATKSNFWGSFKKRFPLDQNEYDEKKRTALIKKQKTRFDNRWRKQREALIYLMRKKYKVSAEEIAEEMTSLTKINITANTVLSIVNKVEERLDTS